MYYFLIVDKNRFLTNKKCGDDENEYNSIPICYTTNAYLEGTIHNPELVKIENIKNIIIDTYRRKYNNYSNFCSKCAYKIFIESRSKLLKSKIKQ